MPRFGFSATFPTTTGSFPNPVTVSGSRGGFGDAVSDALKGVIGAAPSIIGGLLSAKSQRDTLKQQRKLLEAQTKLVGALNPTAPRVAGAAPRRRVQTLTPSVPIDRAAFTPANVATPGFVADETGLIPGGGMGSPMQLRLGPAAGVIGGAVLGEGIDFVQSLFSRGPSGRVGGVRIGSLFHQTPSGMVRPNKVSLMDDGNGNSAFFVHAGVPKTWSKVTLRKPRSCRPR